VHDPGAAGRGRVSSAGPGAGGAPGAGGNDASLERRRPAREEDGGEDYGDALQRAVGGAGILGSTNYQGGTIH